MDKLEKYIRDNRAEFDDKHPPAEVWHNINDRLDDHKIRKMPIGTYMWRAAAIVLFAVVIWLLVDRSEQQDMMVQSDEYVGENDIDFKDVEAFYIREIEQKQKMIVQFVSDYPELDKDLLMEIDQLDSTYQILKSTVAKGHSEKILDAMVVNLQMRIDILNQQIEVLEKIKSIKENENISI